MNVSGSMTEYPAEGYRWSHLALDAFVGAYIVNDRHPTPLSFGVGMRMTG